mgnify:CR=1 FL=1
MGQAFNPYGGFLGMELRRIEFGRFDIVLYLEKIQDGNWQEVTLATDSNVALSTNDIFHLPDPDFPVPGPGVLDRLFSFLEKKIVAFEPLGLNRACRMQFDSGEVFFWLSPEDVSDNLFLATVRNGSKKDSWWLIDDL